MVLEKSIWEAPEDVLEINISMILVIGDPIVLGSCVEYCNWLWGFLNICSCNILLKPPKFHSAGGDTSWGHASGCKGNEISCSRCYLCQPIVRHKMNMVQSLNQVERGKKRIQGTGRNNEVSLGRTLLAFLIHSLMSYHPSLNVPRVILLAIGASRSRRASAKPQCIGQEGRKISMVMLWSPKLALTTAHVSCWGTFFS